MRSETIARYRPELITLLVLTAVSVGVLAGIHRGTFTLALLGATVAGIAVLSAGLIRLFAVAEGVFLLEALGVAVVSPLLFERSIRFELYGLGLALAFSAGVCLHLASKRPEGEAASDRAR